MRQAQHSLQPSSRMRPIPSLRTLHRSTHHSFQHLNSHGHPNKAFEPPHLLACIHCSHAHTCPERLKVLLLLTSGMAATDGHDTRWCSVCHVQQWPAQALHVAQQARQHRCWAHSHPNTGPVTAHNAHGCQGGPAPPGAIAMGQALGQQVCSLLNTARSR